MSQTTLNNSFTLNNPYLEEFYQCAKNSRKREELVKKYAWAVPSAKSIEILVKLSPLIEIGAGTGYWASLIADMGGDIVCYDNQSWSLPHGIHYPTKELEFESLPLTLQFNEGRTLFLCWPPYNDPMAEDCLFFYKGKHVAYVGESKGGCTANDAFFDELGKNWHQTEMVNLPQWLSIHDNLYIFRRKNALEK